MAAITLLLGALAATAQDDIKRVLAWSTVSQIGYMTGALAVGAPAAALFHLLTHAAFKALLFLAAGAVIHAVGSNLMSADGRPAPRACRSTFWSHRRSGSARWPGCRRWPASGARRACWSPPRTPPRATAGAGLGRLAGLAGRAARRRDHRLVRHPPAAAHLLRRAARPTPAARARRTSPPRRLMRWPVLLLAVPGALLGLAAFAARLPRRAWSLRARRTSSVADRAAAAGAARARRGRWPGGCWRRDAGRRPGRGAGPRCGRSFAAASASTTVQDAPRRTPGARARPRGARAVDERVVDGAVEGTGRGDRRARRAAGRACTGRRCPGPRPRVLAGALLLGLAAARRRSAPR